MKKNILKFAVRVLSKLTVYKNIFENSYNGENHKDSTHCAKNLRTLF